MPVFLQNLFPHLKNYINSNYENIDSQPTNIGTVSKTEGYFKVLNGSKPQLVRKLWHKMQIFPFPVLFFSNFVDTHYKQLKMIV